MTPRAADTAPPPAPRRAPAWLLLPGIALAVFLLACAAGWLYARSRIDRALDGRAQALRRAGWTVRLEGRRWSGFPFRLKLTHAQAVLVAPSGWGMEAPGLVAQAVIFDPTHWVFAAPGGLTLDRGAAGPLQVAGASLSASVSGVTRTPWRVAVVGEGLRLAPAPGARPTAFRSIGRWEAYLRPAADASGDGEALWRLTDAMATPHGLVWNFAPEAAVAAAVSARITRLAAAQGPDWPARVRAWASAGGAVRLDRVEARGGPTHVWARGGALSVGPDGRLVGAVPLEIRQAPQDAGAPVAAASPPTPAVGEALDAARLEGERGSTHLVLQGGAVRLGGIRIGPSPRVG